MSTRVRRRAWVARSAVAACVFGGALAVPLGFEILWRFDHVAGSHLQPEVVTVEIGGQDIVHGREPYLPVMRLTIPSSTTLRDSRTSPDSCPTSRSWPSPGFRARSGPTAG